METEKKLLRDYSDIEKGAYLGAISSIATADHSATEEELEYIMALAESADISEEQKMAVGKAAKELSGDELKRCLDILKTSDLRFSLITDLISFAESDKNYSEQEKANIQGIAKYLNIDQQQFSLLDQFVKKTAETNVQPEEIQKPGFLSALGFDQKFKNSGINIGSLTKGLLGIAGPFILAKMLSGRGRSASTNPLARSMGMGGGLGSIISMLSGGRGIGGVGNLLGRLLRR